MYFPDQLHPVQRILRHSLHRFIHQGLPHRPVVNWDSPTMPLRLIVAGEATSTSLQVRGLNWKSPLKLCISHLICCKTETFCWNTFECKMVRHRNKTKTQTGWKQNIEGILWNTNEQIHYYVADFCNSETDEMYNMFDSFLQLITNWNWWWW